MRAGTMLLFKRDVRAERNCDDLTETCCSELLVDSTLIRVNRVSGQTKTSGDFVDPFVVESAAK